jgi:GNAT superfamily N-acetyltransferase
VKLQAKRFNPALREDFFRLHSEENGCGWCFCAAWWVPTWEGWSDRIVEENRELRNELLEQGHYDGYLLYSEDQPIGWCQVGKTGRLEKLVEQFSLFEVKEAWAISCFLIAPQFRGQGMASFMLKEIIEDLQGRGAESVLAFPKAETGLDQLDMWNGPLAMYLEAGFSIWKEDPIRPVLLLDLINDS